VNKNEFTELAYNDHRGALLTLWNVFEEQRAAQAEKEAEFASLCEQMERERADLDALEATVLELATTVNAPAEA